MLGLLWYLQRRIGRRMQRRRHDAEISVIGKQALSPKAQLMIVETDDRRYVLGVTEHGVNLIDSLPANHVARPVRSDLDSADLDSAALDSSDHDSADFESLLAAEQAASGEPQTLRRHRRPEPTDRLGGSILSAQTWRQTADFLRRTR
ncbi:flagellar biosynthetic protein FliO [Microbacterium suwonense]|uniref:Flagellar protein n=1 Tax=Microbacterium suwonense TaxID=683047 RepID=A0ABM8FUM9_9MICO|nr:flagellar biosynthetic protein FliO [Microbacterium suwonense]BDZ39199.1 hypothetical protein GCM10025863_18130 [Microbacterium suwonense]